MDPAVVAEKRVREGAERIFTTNEYAKFLTFAAYFFSYSYQNTVLLYMQDPRATHVAGLHAWTDAVGVDVPDKQKPLYVLYPELTGNGLQYSIRKVFQEPDAGEEKEQPENTIPKCPKHEIFPSFKEFFQKKTKISVYQSVDESSKEVEVNGKAVTVPKSENPEEQFKLLLEYYVNMTFDSESDLIRGAVCNTIKYLVYSYYDFPDANRITFPYISIKEIDDPARMRILQQAFNEARNITADIDRIYLERELEKEHGRVLNV